MHHLHTITMNHLRCFIIFIALIVVVDKQFIEKLIKIFVKINQNVFFNLAIVYFLTHLFIASFHSIVVFSSFSFFLICILKHISSNHRRSIDNLWVTCFFCCCLIILSFRFRSFSFAFQAHFLSFFHHFISSRILLVIIASHHVVIVEKYIELILVTIILALTLDINVYKINVFNIFNNLMRFTFTFWQVMSSKERVTYLHFNSQVHRFNERALCHNQHSFIFLFMIFFSKNSIKFKCFITKINLQRERKLQNFELKNWFQKLKNDDIEWARIDFINIEKKNWTND